MVAASSRALAPVVDASRQQRPAQSGGGGREPDDQRWPGLRVLVAEDNRVNQLVAARLLAQLGCSVEVVADGEAAIDIIRRTPFDIVFMDSQMPKVDGLSATRAIRTALSGDRLPIISLTANAFNEHREACFAAGMDDFIDKPIRAAEIRRVLAKWCPDGAIDDPDQERTS